MADQPVYPIIYLRGFAGNTSGIDQADDDPFDGFNIGATHVRVGGDGQPQFYQFEGPLVRLMEDEDYRVVVHGGQQAYLTSAAPKSQPPNSVWIYRYYDSAANTFGTPATHFDLPAAARGLLGFVDLVRAKTGAWPRLARRALDGRADLPEHDPEGVPGTAPGRRPDHR